MMHCVDHSKKLKGWSILPQVANKSEEKMNSKKNLQVLRQQSFHRRKRYSVLQESLITTTILSTALVALIIVITTGTFCYCDAFTMLYSSPHDRHHRSDFINSSRKREKYLHTIIHANNKKDTKMVSIGWSSCSDNLKNTIISKSGTHNNTNKGDMNRTGWYQLSSWRRKFDQVMVGMRTATTIKQKKKNTISVRSSTILFAAAAVLSVIAITVLIFPVRSAFADVITDAAVSSAPTAVPVVDPAAAASVAAIIPAVEQVATTVTAVSSSSSTIVITAGVVSSAIAIGALMILHSSRGVYGVVTDTASAVVVPAAAATVEVVTTVSESVALPSLTMLSRLLALIKRRKVVVTVLVAGVAAMLSAAGVVMNNNNVGVFSKRWNLNKKVQEEVAEEDTMTIVRTRNSGNNSSDDNDGIITAGGLAKEKLSSIVQQARQQPKAIQEEALLAARYGSILDLEDKAYQILLDLGMI